jgi:hypothetical protein
LIVPILAQISPRGVFKDDESNLLDAQPAFNLLLARNSVANILEVLEVYEAVEFVMPAKF